MSGNINDQIDSSFTDNESILSISSTNLSFSSIQKSDISESDKNDFHSTKLSKNKDIDALHSTTSIRNALKEMGNINSNSHSSGITFPTQAPGKTNPRHRTSSSIISGTSLTDDFIMNDNNEPFDEMQIIIND